MAARTGRLFQDQNLNADINGAGTISRKADFTGQRKARAGGRKPLGDLSNTGKPPINAADGKKALDGSVNSGKPSVSEPLKQLKSKNLTVIMNAEVVSAKTKNLESNRITAKKASERSRPGSRKALSDISNLVKPQAPEIKNKNSLKPSSLREEPLDPSAIAEEQFLHNHRECIKSQFEAVDVHQFFKTVGLENDLDDDLTIYFELPAISKMKSESTDLELEEVPEQLSEVQSTCAQPGSPEHCKTPKLSSCSTMWNDFAVNFKLIDSPKLSKN